MITGDGDDRIDSVYGNNTVCGGPIVIRFHSHLGDDVMSVRLK